jgi:ribokinase
MAKVTTLGTFMMDLVAYTPRRPNNGETIRGESFSIALGGKGFNQAIAAGRAGVESAMLGNLGTDGFGDDFMRAFKEEGVQASDIERHPDLGTGVGHIGVQTSDGDNAIIIIPQSNDRADAAYIERHKKTILESDILLLQNELPKSGNVAAAKLAKTNGVKVILTPAPVGPMDEFIGLCDLVVPNEGEAEAITGVSSNNPEEQAKALSKKFGCDQVVITLGPKGAFVLDGTKSEFISAPKVEALDTIAAGDTLCANLAAKLAQGADLFTAVKYGVFAATLKVTRKGSAMGSPTPNEVEQFMEGK